MQVPVANATINRSDSNIQNTQISLIEKIADWINGIDYPTKNALVKWLYGSANARRSERASPGSGQSQGVGQYTVQTLAYELAMRLPQQFCEQLLQSVERDPHVFSRSLDVQVTNLIFEPLGHM